MQPLVEWGCAGEPLPGQSESGDRCVVQATGGQVTIAVVDGLGHGSEAARVSRIITDILESHAGEGILPLFQRCHSRLRTTRGAAMTVARYDANAHRIRWLGAGNVRALLLRQSPGGATTCRDMLIYGGTVGVRLPTLEVSSLDAAPGDLLFLATDGIHGRFADALHYGEAPQAQADRLLDAYRVITDDALILVARLVR
ncbi:MAG TPA: SpoIIE family protein phosphatase [Steroidobacteraceae bacterium]|jgi:serine phosphatase RsbU (regulator of sigma subunit)